MARRAIAFAVDADIRINQADINALASPGGPVWSWADRRARPFMVRAAKSMVPVRTGRLQRSIRGEMRKVNQSSADIMLIAGGRSAHYAGYVHEGTGPQAGLFLLYADDRQVGGSRLPDAIAGGYADKYKIWKYQVAGQEANPFLSRGATAALSALGAI